MMGFELPALRQHLNKCYGKYRGVVVSNDDSKNADGKKLGRLLVKVPSVFQPNPRSLVGKTAKQVEDLLPTVWAEPCFPYGGPLVGWYAIPPVGSLVWIEFEAGDITRPIWVGVWQTPTGKGQLPAEAQKPEIKVFRTDKHYLRFSDEVDHEFFEYKNKKNNTVLKFDGDGSIYIMGKGNSVSLDSGGDIAILHSSGTNISVYGDQIELNTADGENIQVGKQFAQIDAGATSIMLDSVLNVVEITGKEIFVDGDDVSISSAIDQYPLMTSFALDLLNTELVKLQADMELLKAHVHEVVTVGGPTSQAGISKPATALAGLNPVLVLPVATPALTGQVTGG